MELCQPFEKRATEFQDEILNAMDGVIGVNAQMVDIVHEHSPFSRF